MLAFLVADFTRANSKHANSIPPVHVNLDETRAGNSDPGSQVQVSEKERGKKVLEGGENGLQRSSLGKTEESVPNHLVRNQPDLHGIGN